MQCFHSFCLAVLVCFLTNLLTSFCHDNNDNTSHYAEITKALLTVAEAKETLLRAQQSGGNDYISRMKSDILRHDITGHLKKALSALSQSGYYETQTGSGYAYGHHNKSISSGTEPDAKRNLTQLISSQGYPVEKFIVQTQDGFLLDLHRIPHGKGNLVPEPLRAPNSDEKPIVYLQHGLLSSACDWVMNFGNDSLGFLLADAGYDVWLGNSRGNTFSLKHVQYSPNDDKFWDWSFDEMAKFDTTSFIDFILKKTGQSSLHYIGHSQGTTMAFALLSLHPEYQHKIRLFTGLAPVTIPIHARSPIRLLSKVPDELLYLVFGRRDFLPSDFLVKLAVDALCEEKATRWICDNVLFLIVGPDLSNLNQSRLAVYMNHSPAGASVKDLVHFSQLTKATNFTMYDYGSKTDNEKHYGQASPPIYDVTKVKVPSILFSGTNDWLADTRDVERIGSQLSNMQSSYIIPTWNHLDFVWGKDAAKLCYKNILLWLKKF